MRRSPIARWLTVCLVVAGTGIFIATAFVVRAFWRGGGAPGPTTAFVGAGECGECHANQMRSWRRTFHRTMTQDVSAERAAGVAGDFAEATYFYDGVSARMHRNEAGDFLMTFVRADGATAPVQARVVRAVGSRRYQQYLADVGGVLWRLPMAFHVEERRWFHMNGAFLTPDSHPERDGEAASSPVGRAPVPPAASSPGGQPVFGGGDFDRHVTRWNDNCIFCHNVAPNPGLDLHQGTFQTTVAELGVACEACHGPGGGHVRANEDPVRRYLIALTGAKDSTIVNPSRLSPGRAADVCGRCHGQRISDDVAPVLAHGDRFLPGEDLALHSSPLWRDTPLGTQTAPFASRFWDDGTPRLTAYEYQGLLQSACATRGTATCTSCHGMHEGDPRGQLRSSARGDSGCTTCHGDLASPAAARRHARHDPAGPGGRCVSCHMPRIVYGVLDTHPSHRIEIPDPARARTMGRPDACTLCHVDEARDWAVRARSRLWPLAQRESAPAAAHDQERAADAYGPADGDLLAPRDALFGGDPVARALAADAFGRAPFFHKGATAADEARSRMDALLQAMSGDRYPAVRHLAARALGRSLAGRADQSSPDSAAVGVARATLRGFDPTGPAERRSAVILELRRQLSLPDGTDGEKITRLRAASRAVDIDIGE